MTILVITGSRSITDYNLVANFLDRFKYRNELTVMFSGHQRGKYVQNEHTNGSRFVMTVDGLAELWALRNNIPVRTFPAEWMKDGVYNKGAGQIRNRAMIDEAIRLSKEQNENWCLVGWWDGVSKGAGGTIGYARKVGGEVIVCEVTDKQDVSTTAG